ncbi:hypothetical protein QU96_2053 [Acinetobacter baumannii]|nr:hypothetical protein QU96_2053 [Acinetobacter baumannii]KMV10149.1 hypothetical protein AB988_3281 [Acinetobacter baumannii]
MNTTTTARQAITQNIHRPYGLRIWCEPQYGHDLSVDATTLSQQAQ